MAGKTVRLPSGRVLDVEEIVYFDPKTNTLIFRTPHVDVNDAIGFTAEDFAMLAAWAEKRPLLVPPPRVPGKKGTPA